MVCKFKKKNGERCGAAAMPNGYCYLHNPKVSAKEKKAVQRKGGENRTSRIKEPLPEVRIRNPKQAALLLAEIIDLVRTGRIDVKVGNTIGNLVIGFLKSYEMIVENNKKDGAWFSAINLDECPPQLSHNERT